MAEIKLKTDKTLKERVNSFLFSWHQFPIDYWWRKKYNVPFGSAKHREMNFIDMYVEFMEGVIISKAIYEADKEVERVEDEALGFSVNDDNVVKMTKKEIDEDYDNLDLSQFDKK